MDGWMDGSEQWEKSFFSLTYLCFRGSSGRQFQTQSRESRGEKGIDRSITSSMNQHWLMNPFHYPESLSGFKTSSSLTIHPCFYLSIFLCSTDGMRHGSGWKETVEHFRLGIVLSLSRAHSTGILDSHSPTKAAITKTEDFRLSNIVKEFSIAVFLLFALDKL